MKPRWVVDTPARLVEVCRLEGVVVIRKIGGVWHAGLPWANKGEGPGTCLLLLVGGNAGGAL